jgi:hypothetical protein
MLIGPTLLLRRVTDPSPWLHLRVGQWLLDGHRFGTPDPWAPFASHPYAPTQWLPSIVTAKAYGWFGTPILAWERAASITVLALLLLAWLSRMARPWVASVVSALAVYAAWPSLTERPQLVGFVLLVPVLAAWWSTSQDCRPRWWLVPLTWLAASSHGIWAMGGVVGVVVTAGLLISRRASPRELVRLGSLLAACATAAALTPIGPRLLLTPFEVGSQGRQFVGEWLPSSVRDPHVACALLMFVLTWLVWVRTGRRAPLTEVALLVLGVVLALGMQRTVAVAALVAAPLLASAAEMVLARRGPRFIPVLSRPLLALWAAATVLGLAIAGPVAVARDQTPRGVPTTLAPALRALPPATRILVNGDTSGWLLFAAPQLQPVFDLRIEVYSPQHVERYISAVAAKPGWQGFVADTGSTTALVKSDSPLAAALVEQLAWRESGTDAGLVLLEAPK